MSQHTITVKTIDNIGLQDASNALNALILQNFVPDIIIGIRTGGYIIAEIMAKELQKKPLLLAISRQRTGTQKKSRIKCLKKILGLLPYKVTDYLRIIEHKYLHSKPIAERQSFSPNIDELSAIRGALRACDNYKILIVDDAIDSGETMKAVLDVVRAEANSDCIIKTAAITVTTDSPLVQPDYTLYRHVLCRLPWSFDFKN
ncbi:MAG: phosphoribosyltransferase family protein [Rickettsiales bacterium]